MRITVTYDLTNPVDSHSYKCAQEATDACYTLESLQDSIDLYMSKKTTPEACLIDLYDTVLQWKKRNNVS